MSENPTQDDRIAASKVHPYSHNSALILDGQRDGTDIVQAAMHSRLAHICGDAAAMREACAKVATERAKVLRTPQGRLEAGWHQHDADMVADELDRVAAAIRAQPDPAPSPVRFMAVVGSVGGERQIDSIGELMRLINGGAQFKSIRVSSPAPSPADAHDAAVKQSLTTAVAGERERIVSRAIREHLCRRDVMQYLDNDEDCEGLARAVLAVLPPDAILATRPSSDALQVENDRLREAGRMAQRGADNVFHELNRDPNWRPARTDYTTLGYLLNNIAGTAGIRAALADQEAGK